MTMRANAAAVALALLAGCNSATNNPQSAQPGTAAMGAPTGTAASRPGVGMPPSPTTADNPPPGSSQTGTAGSAAAMPPASISPGTTPPTAANPGTTTQPMPATNECGLHTQWMGDDLCIKPPPADKGFQIHIGPSNYDNPESKYLLQPGQETVEDVSETTGNTTDVYYYYRQYRMRPGTHHMIIYKANGFGLGGLNGARLGGSQNLSKDNPDNGVIAPENQGVGMMLPANTPLDISLHYMNYTDKPIIKDIWVNFWYRDAKDVTQPAIEMFSMSPMNVAPGAHVVIHGSCPITETGRVLTLYGHRHANNLRFSAWHTRGSKSDLVYEDYDWEHPLALEFSSIVTNTPPDPVNKVGGGWSGVLDLQSGDSLDFECEIVNMTTNTFTGQNEAKGDEMCILVGDTVQATVPGFCTYTTTMK